MFVELQYLVIYTLYCTNHTAWTISNETREKLVRLKIIVDIPIVLWLLADGTYTTLKVVLHTLTRWRSLLKHKSSHSKAVLSSTILKRKYLLPRHKSSRACASSTVDSSEAHQHNQNSTQSTSQIVYRTKPCTKLNYTLVRL